MCPETYSGYDYIYTQAIITKWASLLSNSAGICRRQPNSAVLTGEKMQSLSEKSVALAGKFILGKSNPNEYLKSWEISVEIGADKNIGCFHKC